MIFIIARFWQTTIVIFKNHKNYINTKISNIALLRAFGSVYILALLSLCHLL